MYPREYSELVEKYAFENSLPVELVFAVILTESSFRADALSSAGAKGLMQITDDTNDWISRMQGDVGWLEDAEEAAPSRLQTADVVPEGRHRDAAQGGGCRRHEGRARQIVEGDVRQAVDDPGLQQFLQAIDLQRAHLLELGAGRRARSRFAAHAWKRHSGLGPPTCFHKC